MKLFWNLKPLSWLSRICFIFLLTQSSLSGFAGLHCSQSNSLIGGHEIKGKALGTRLHIRLSTGFEKLFIIAKQECFMTRFERNRHYFKGSWKSRRLSQRNLARGSLSEEKLLGDLRVKDLSLFCTVSTVEKPVLFDYYAHSKQTPEVVEIQNDISWSFGRTDHKMGKRVDNTLDN